MIMTNVMVCGLYIILMNVENKLIFLTSLFLLGNMFSAQDHLGSHIIYDNVASKNLSPYHLGLSFLKALSPMLIVIAFHLYDITVTEMLYYMLVMQLICLLIHLSIPDDD